MNDSSGNVSYNDLSIRDDSIQKIYRSYRDGMFIVNRRYQRKLVWTIEEKRSFIDSILKGFPVPLVLLAEIVYNGETRFEIIDGMQRLNAIFSFIEGEFEIGTYFFDLNSMAETKSLLDDFSVLQKEPVLDRKKCTFFASYTLPVSIYKYKKQSDIDEIFRRINSNGKHLSKQELRQAGSTGHFANLVRNIACIIRGDVSHSDQLDLIRMKEISITSKDLSYGINVDSLFWVSQKILSREQVRESKDEELIADIIACMILEPHPPSNIYVLDSYYGIQNPDKEDEELSRQSDIETAVQKVTGDIIQKQFIYVYEQIKNILSAAGKAFNLLMYKNASPRTPRYFQTVFLAFYQLLVKDSMKISDYGKVVRKLDGIGEKHINIGDGGNWSARSRQDNINSVVGVIKSSLDKKSLEDPAFDSWVTEFENILMQSFTEQNSYDFKQGFCALDTQSLKFNEDIYNKIIKTLCAMANNGPNSTGYVIVGVCDTKATADHIKTLHSIDCINVNKSFWVSGIDHEAVGAKGIDGYFQKIVEKIKHENISEFARDQISREVKLIKYFNKSVLILKVKSGKEPCHYNDKYYVRRGSNNDEIPGSQFSALFSRFQSNA